MFELSIEREFCAAHAITIDGQRETVHGHNWRVTVVLAGEQLDADGMLVDFHDVERKVDAILKPWQNADLNAVAPFDSINPTAEQVSKQIAEMLERALPRNVDIRKVSVTEAPGCTAAYLPGSRQPGK